ncbi:PIG-L deacetylase family protein [Salinifilum aidingensis]
MGAVDHDRVLVVTAHPDDADFAAAGTVASWVAAGELVTYCVCTSGDAGGFDDTPREAVPHLRESEQRAAAAAVGVRDVRFLGHRDGSLQPDMALRLDVSRVIRQVRPHRVLTHSPEINWEHIPASHPDHRAVGEAALAAVYPDARNAFAHPELVSEGLQPWSVPELWLVASPECRINRAVDITDHFRTKVAALAAHTSQTSHLTDLAGMLRPGLARIAEQHGMPGRLAESFQVVNTG